MSAKSQTTPGYQPHENHRFTERYLDCGSPLPLLDCRAAGGAEQQ